MQWFVLFSQLILKILNWVENTRARHENSVQQDNKKKAVALERLRSSLRAKRDAREQFDQYWTDDVSDGDGASERMRFDKYRRD